MCLIEHNFVIIEHKFDCLNLNQTLLYCSKTSCVYYFHGEMFHCKCPIWWENFHSEWYIQEQTWLPPVIWGFYPLLSSPRFRWSIFCNCIWFTYIYLYLIQDCSKHLYMPHLLYLIPFLLNKNRLQALSLDKLPKIIKQLPHLGGML